MENGDWVLIGSDAAQRKPDQILSHCQPYTHLLLQAPSPGLQPFGAREQRISEWIEITVGYSVSSVSNYPDTQHTAVIYAALIAGSLSLGFWAGRRATTPPSFKPLVSSRTGNASLAEGSDSDEDGDGDISALRVEDCDDCKMVNDFSDLWRSFIYFLGLCC